MTYKAKCPQCRREIEANETQLGKVVVCPNCQNRILFRSKKQPFDLNFRQFILGLIVVFLLVEFFGDRKWVSAANQQMANLLKPFTLIFHSTLPQGQRAPTVLGLAPMITDDFGSVSNQQTDVKSNLIVEPENPFFGPDAEISDVVGREVNDEIEITGIIRNLRSYPLEGISVHFNIYDASGNKIDEGFDDTSGIDANGTWSFSAHSINGRKGGQEYRFDEFYSDDRGQLRVRVDKYWK